VILKYFFKKINIFILTPLLHSVTPAVVFFLLWISPWRWPKKRRNVNSFISCLYISYRRLSTLIPAKDRTDTRKKNNEVFSLQVYKQSCSFHSLPFTQTASFYVTEMKSEAPLIFIHFFSLQLSGRFPIYKKNRKPNLSQFLTYAGPQIKGACTNFLIIKPTSCTNFSILF
jgi:hypothetical protein